MYDLRPVGYVIGLLVATLGAIMVIPMVADLVVGNGHWQVFLESALLTGFLGGLLAVACASRTRRGLSLHDSFLLTTGIWVVLPAFGALPFVIGTPYVSFTDAYFEAVSGMTTTGSTVFFGLDSMPAGTLLWRGILQWLGGLGIVIVALIFLPVMRVGGMQFFRSEGFDTLGKILPRALDISTSLLWVYVWLTVACGVTYFALGMTAFEALVHALTTISTGGFSTSDQSFGLFSGPAEYAGVVFMLLASMPFIRFVQLTSGSLKPVFEDIQVRAYLLWTAIAIGAVVAYEFATAAAPIEETLRVTAFNIVTNFSGTGYGSTDIGAWDPFPFAVVIVVGMIGGCTSSTGCSVKVFRYLVLIESIKVQLKRLYTPNSVVKPRLQGRPLTDDVLNSVIVMMTMFFVTFGVIAVALAFTGLSMGTALTASWTAVFNVGPAFGPEVGPSGAMNAFPALAKWLMIVGMLLGRLELISVFVLFTTEFWRG
jgi:trk system potassium uptake protein TrkH